MRILCINLKRSKDRYQFQEQQARKYGLVLEFIEAIDYKDLSVEQLETAAKHWTRPIVGKDVGCFMSHRRAWSVVEASSEPCVIVEDDIVFSDQICHALKAIESHSFSADQIYDLEFAPRKHLISRFAVWEDPPVLARRMFINKTGAGCYVLTPQVATRLLKEVKPYVMVDSWLWTRPWLQVIQVEPCPAAQSRDLSAFYDFESATSQGDILSYAPGTFFRRKKIRLSLTLDQLKKFVIGLMFGVNRALKLDLEQYQHYAQVKKADK